MNSVTIEMNPIGIIHTPYKKFDDGIPIQGTLQPRGEGYVELLSLYIEGLKDLEGFSHIWLLYHFDRTETVKLRAKPYLDTVERGIFSIRSPHRPNHIGLTLVRLMSIEENILQICGVDMLSGTPLLDIKPYNPGFDACQNPEIGWMEQFFSDDNVKRNEFVKSESEWLHE